MVMPACWLLHMKATEVKRRAELPLRLHTRLEELSTVLKILAAYTSTFIHFRRKYISSPNVVHGRLYTPHDESKRILARCWRLRLLWLLQRQIMINGILDSMACKHHGLQSPTLKFSLDACIVADPQVPQKTACC